MSNFNLSHTIFNGGDLSCAILNGANLQNAQLRGVDLTKAKFCGSNLSDADLEDADLSAADLSGSNLRRANLNYTNLSETDFSGADVKDAKFIQTSGLDKIMEKKLKAQGADLEDSSNSTNKSEKQLKWWIAVVFVPVLIALINAFFPFLNEILKNYDSFKSPEYNYTTPTLPKNK